MNLTAPGIHGERVPMRDRSNETVDFCIIGAGAGGGTVGAKLAEAGFSVVILDAGKHWDPTKDFKSDENSSHPLYWLDERITTGKNPLVFGSNNSGKGVGGGTTHYSMFKLRQHPEDFRLRSIHGEVPGADVQDWPITFDELEPYYEEVEWDLQIAGPVNYPWGKPRRKRYPQREHPLNGVGETLVRGGRKLGIPVTAGPISTLSAPSGDRNPCVYRGFCNYGCTTNAKSSVLTTYIPRAIRAGAEVRPECMVAKIEHNDAGLVTGVLYFREGSRELHRQRAQAVIVAGYSVETPRLLLNSASSLFPHGLANSNGYVGRGLMVHAGNQSFAKFEQEIYMYKAPPAIALTEHYNRDMSDTDFIRGFTIQTIGPHVVDFAKRLSQGRGLWGQGLRDKMLDLNFYSSLGIIGEVLWQYSNGVELHPSERDQYGLPIPKITFALHDNDVKIKTMAMRVQEDLLRAAGGTDVWSMERTAHLMGSCRMGNDPRNSVVDKNYRTHEIPNLFICDGSLFPSSSAVNPSLTIEALAARAADVLEGLARRGNVK